MVGKRKLSDGLSTFLIIWFGQLVSLLGTRMTTFALLIWAYQQTESATSVALLGFFAFVSSVLVSPFAGVWVDRWDRRRVMLLADTGAGLMTVVLIVLFSNDSLQLWHLYVTQFIVGIFDAFQRPAYQASVTLLIPKEHYARASGLRSLASSFGQVIAPFFAGFLLTIVDIQGVLVVDIFTFMIAVLTLMRVRIPNPEKPKVEEPPSNFWEDTKTGFRFIAQRRGLVALMIVFAEIHFFAALAYMSILPAMILARSGGDEIALAIAQAGLGIGGMVGGILVSTWGGPKRKIHGVLAFTAASYILGDIGMALGQTAPIWFIAGFLTACFIPFIMGSTDAIWQSKVPPHLQGRVFSVQKLVQDAVLPIGMLIAGPIADNIFEPWMASDGALAPVLGGLIGTGTGAGMALMFLITGICGCFLTLSGYLYAPLRNVETDLPDYDE